MENNTAISQLELRRKILSIAYTEIPVSDKSPLYNIFLHRKKTAMYLEESRTENEMKLLEEMIEYCNLEIKKYLNIW